MSFKNILVGMGFLALALFVLIYGVELFGHHGPPVTIRWPWPTIITLVLWPLLMAAYVWLALREEREIAEKFGEEYQRYTSRTPRFFPQLLSSACLDKSI